MASGADYGWISIRSDCDWHGNSSMGGFLSIRVDGKRGGAVAPLDTERVPVYPGKLTVRVLLQAWYRSPRVVVTVSPGATAPMGAGMPAGGFFSRFIKAMINPFRWLVPGEIQEVTQNPG